MDHFERRNPEAAAVRAEINSTSSSELIELYSRQAEEFCHLPDNSNKISIFISSGAAKNILHGEDSFAWEAAAEKFIRLNPTFVPGHVPEDERSSFVIAVANEVKKPEYNQ